MGAHRNVQERGITLHKSGKPESQSREELGRYCQQHGIAAACFVEKCSPEELLQIQEIARTGNLPELPEPKASYAGNRH